MGPDTKLILSLVNRITVRLPSNSGKKLDSLENDPLVQQTVAALIDLSKYRLPTIASTIVTVIENICKSPSITDEYIPYDVLQSQLFLLRMFSACLQHHWQFVRKTNNNNNNNNKPSGINENIHHMTSDTSSNHSNTTNGMPKSTSDGALPSELQDPPPLEEGLAKYIVSIMSRFMHQMSFMEERENSTSHTTNISRTEYYTSTSVASISSDIIIDIYKAASRVIFYISASNWHIMFIKIKTRIIYLTTTLDENPNFADLRLLECCALNSKRLSAILVEFCTAFLHLKKPAQLMAAVVLRHAIWSWIETYPMEFIRLCQSQKRLEGGPEILFDICNTLADTTRKKAIFWPLQTMLLILCPDLLLAATVSESRGINTKKTVFLAALRKSLKGGRTADLAAICYVDICKAATYVPKDMSIALRHIVPDIESELKQKLFDIQQPLIADSLVSNLGIIIDHRCLLADCLVAMFRLNPRNVLRSLFPVCLSERAPTLFKMSLVKACLAITSEEYGLPWNPTSAALYDLMGGPLRKLLLDVTSREAAAKSEISSLTNSTTGRKTNIISAATDKKKKEVSQRNDGGNDRLELILDLLRLYQNDPMLAIRGDSEDRFEQNAATMVSMANCLRENSTVVRDAAAECLFKLHSPEAITEWGESDQFMEAFWKISSQIVFTVAKQLLDSRERNDSLKKLLDLLKRLLICRNDFLTLHQDITMHGSDVRERLQASIGLEVALLVLLCSADPDICTAAMTCFGHLCMEAQITESTEDPRQASLTIVENLPIYVEMTSNTGIVAGRKSQQKRIRRLLRMMTHYAPGNLAAWEEAWKRWKYMTPAMIRPHEETKDENVDIKKGGQAWHDKLRTNRQPVNVTNRTDGLDDDKSSEWQNYAGFLASLGGICLMADASPTSPASPGPRSFSDPPHLRRTSSPSESAIMVDRFVMEMVDLLLCDNVIVREWVMDILGTDLSPALYPIMFRHLETVLGRCFGSDGDPLCSPRYTLFVEQAISVLKLVLDRMEETVDSLFTVDFGGLIDQYAKYLNKLGSGQLALKMKIRFCHLCEVLMAKKDKISIRQEFRLRNKLLEIIVEWTSDFSLNPDTGVDISSSNRGDKYHRDLDLACLKTIVGLLQQLPLQPSDLVHETDSTQVKSRIFYKYFSFFLKLLNRCRLSEIEAGSQHNRKQGVMMVNKNKENATYLAPLKDCTILAMSNLLNANVDAGLKYSLSMGYHEDTRMRTAFMQVLTNILNQGTEFETLAETVMTDRYEKLVDMLVDSDLNISLSLCDVCPASDIDDVANVLLASFSSRGKIMVLLKAVIEKEVQNTENETELFRRTSIATRLLSVFAKTNGAEYVQSVLQPVFHKLAEKPADERTYELDSTKVGPGEDVLKNKHNVVTSTEMLLNAICASADKAPKSFREVCHCILTSVRERFPEAKYTAVGAFIFLRFFCPAIVSPESEGLIKPMTTVSREMRRGHLMATKVIQNLANNVLFGAKETYMIVLNDFLTSNIYKVTSFLREISIVPTDVVVAAASIDDNESRPMDDKSYAMLHRVLADNMERISRDLAARRFRNHGDQESLTAWKRQLDKSSNLLAQLGRPPEIAKQEFSGLRSYTFAASNQLYAEFMRRNSHRSVEPIASKNIFYEGGTSKAGRRVYYFITRNVINDSIDFELLTYYMLQTMERATNKPFEIVIDLTLFGPSNEVSNQWINQILQLLPFDSFENVGAVHLYNPNSYLRKYIKKLTRPITNKLSKRTTFAVTLAELHEHIQPSEVRLPKSTTALDTEASAVFYPVNKLSQYKLNIPVTVKISAEYVQVMTVRKQELIYGVSMVTNDVYHISEIEDVTLGRTTDSVANEFSFKYNKGKSQLVLSTPKRDAVVSMIRHSKRRYEMAKPTSISERNIRPNDVPGRLLNMALLNIGSDDPHLRLAAYNLLYSLSMTFNFDVGKQLLDARDLCLPANSSAFIINISEKIAAAEPNLTLEFLSECFVGFNKSNESLRYLCLDYMVPWLPNLSLFCHSAGNESNPDLVKTKEVIRMLIDLTVARTDMYKLVQAKIWKTIGKIDDLLNLVLDAFVQFSNEHGVGSPQAEAMADTFVTLSNVAVRGKVIARLRKVLQKTSFKPTRSLTEHWTWTEIAVLVRFILMLSFNNRGPVKSYVPEIFHIVSLVVGVGPTIIRASVHGLVVNMIQSLCTSMPLPEVNVQRLQLLLTEVSDSKVRLLFGLHKSHANAFTLTPDTLNDPAEPIQLLALESVITQLIDVLQWGAPSSDMANIWRARWMSLVASTAFQFNPAIQPRAFVVLGCLGREEVDDDLLYQILVALRGALAIFNESDPNLVLSIMMCLKNIVESLPSDSRYLLPLFWVAVALVQINNGPIFCMSVEFLLAVVRALDTDEFFTGDTMTDVLLAAREPMADVARELDELCGVNFETHFSFAMATIFLKGMRYNNAKDTIYQALTVFLDIECKQDTTVMEAQTLGYLGSLLPLAVKNESLRDVLRLSGLSDDFVQEGGSTKYYSGLFDKLDIPDNTTALLLISMMATSLHSAESESERLLLYGLLAEAAISMPEVFRLVYDSLLPKMNQVVLSSNTQPIIESVKTILLIACSDSSFNSENTASAQTQQDLLQQVGFTALAEPGFGASSTNAMQHSKLASEVIERIIA